MTCGAACPCRRRRSEPTVGFIQSPQALGSPGVEREPLDSVVGRSLACIEIDIPTEEPLGARTYWTMIAKYRRKIIRSNSAVIDMCHLHLQIVFPESV